MSNLRLRCLGGQPTPEDISEDAARVSKLSDAATQELWSVIEPCVLQPMSPVLEQRLTAFCQHFELAEADLGHTVRIVCFLLRHAAAIHLPRAQFAEDLEAMWPSQRALHAALLEPYEGVIHKLREGLLADALVKHGNVLVDIDWRVDRVIGAKPAPRIDLPVALVTLAYRKSSGDDRLTLQMTPEQLARAASVFTALARETQQLLAAGAPQASAATTPSDEPTSAAASSDEPASAARGATDSATS